MDKFLPRYWIVTKPGNEHSTDAFWSPYINGGEEYLSFREHESILSKKIKYIGHKCPPHLWDSSGERCIVCGDKDWMT